MAPDEERLVEEPLFLACTRPALILGVPMEAMGVNLIVSTVSFLAGGSLLYLLIAPVLHLVFQAICKADPNAFRVLYLYVETRGRARNGGLWGGSSASPLRLRRPVPSRRSSVADVVLTPTPRAAAARELDPTRTLPFARHVNDQVVALDGGALMVVLRLEGASFETADPRDINDWHAKLNGAWRNLASDRLAIWHHLVRRSADPVPAKAFRSAFAADLDAAYRGRIERTRMFVNELFVTVVLHPGREAADRTQAWFTRLLHASNMDLDTMDAIRRLEDAARDLAQHLSRYEPRILGLYEQDGLAFSEPLEAMRLVLTGAPQRVPLVRGHLGGSIYTTRVIFGREALEIRDVASARYGGLFGIKEYPASTRPGLWDGLLSAPFPFVAAQSFSFLSKTAAQAVMTRKQNQMLSARDRAASQIGDLDTALDDLMSNRFVMGDHQASVLVYGDTPRELADHLSRARALMADSGLVVAREDLGLEAAFWAQFPGNFRLRLRPAAITSRNFASLAPFHTHPAGRASGNHWGPAVTTLRTSAGSPFAFNFHVGDLGHTFICGPSGSGKTVVQNFMLAQLEAFGAQRSSSTRTAAPRSSCAPAADVPQPAGRRGDGLRALESAGGHAGEPRLPGRAGPRTGPAWRTAPEPPGGDGDRLRDRGPGAPPCGAAVRLRASQPARPARRGRHRGPARPLAPRPDARLGAGWRGRHAPARRALPRVRHDPCARCA